MRTIGIQTVIQKGKLGIQTGTVAKLNYVSMILLPQKDGDHQESRSFRADSIVY